MTVILRKTLSLLFLSFFIFQSAVSQKCATTLRDSVAQANDPSYLKHRQERISHIRNLDARSKKTDNTIIYVPTVIHVIHTSLDGSISDDPDIGNISEEQIASQMRVLNEDYRRKIGTPGFNDHPDGADMQIEFCLAKFDPDGNPTTGITRHYRDKVQYDPVADDREIKQIVQWPVEEYMNIYVVPFLKNGFLGYASFPDEPREWDGIVMSNRYFGDRIGTAQFGFPYNEGRTLTHEVGHWLGLLHTWGDGGCGIDDGCDDTPESDAGNFRCDTTHVSCGTIDMVRNYMDYSDDDCFNIFTNCQRDIARATFDSNTPNNRNDFLLATQNGSINCSLDQDTGEVPVKLTRILRIGTVNYERAEYIIYDLGPNYPYDIIIHDARGIRVSKLSIRSNNFGELRFSLGNRPAGIYFLTLKLANGEVKRFKISGPVR
jgi:hypothetical protein